MSEVLTVRNPPEQAGASRHSSAGRAALLAALLLPALLLAACGGGWSSSETYTGDIRATVPRPAGAGLGATAEPETDAAGEAVPDPS